MLTAWLVQAVLPNSEGLLLLDIGKYLRCLYDSCTNAERLGYDLNIIPLSLLKGPPGESLGLFYMRAYARASFLLN